MVGGDFPARKASLFIENTKFDKHLYCFGPITHTKHIQSWAVNQVRNVNHGNL